MNVTVARVTASLAASAAVPMRDPRIDAETTQLAREAQAGNTDAFCALIDLHERAARRVALIALGNGAEADEAVQEACIAAWKRIADLDEPAAFRAWLVRIAWRKALDRRRSLGAWLKRLGKSDTASNPTSSVRGSTIEAVVDASPRADDELLNRERDRVVAQMIRSLPARLRDPFLLAASGEHRYEEIAAILRIPEGTVKWRVSEARRLLREKLTRVGIGR